MESSSFPSMRELVDMNIQMPSNKDIALGLSTNMGHEAAIMALRTSNLSGEDAIKRYLGVFKGIRDGLYEILLNDMEPEGDDDE